MFLLHNGPPASGAHNLGVVDVIVDGVSELSRGHTFISINRSRFPPWHIKVLLHDIHQLVQRFCIISFCHIHREANFVSNVSAVGGHRSSQANEWKPPLPMYTKFTQEAKQLNIPKQRVDWGYHALYFCGYHAKFPSTEFQLI